MIWMNGVVLDSYCAGKEWFVRLTKCIQCAAITKLLDAHKLFVKMAEAYSSCEPQLNQLTAPSLVGICVGLGHRFEANEETENGFELWRVWVEFWLKYRPTFVDLSQVFAAGWHGFLQWLSVKEFEMILEVKKAVERVSIVLVWAVFPHRETSYEGKS